MVEFLEFGKAKFDKEEKLLSYIRDGKYCIKVTSSSDNSTDLKDLLKINHIIQKMLPKMPKEYILRQVFDPSQCVLSLWSTRDNLVIGATCFRPVYSRDLVELVFLAVDSSLHINGFGTVIMNILKELCKMQYAMYKKDADFLHKTNFNLTIDKMKLKIVDTEIIKVFGDSDDLLSTVEKANINIYILTYADNSAIGFFKKNKFSLNPSSTQWRGFIKDYEGGTLMECKVYPHVNCLNKRKEMEILKAKIFEKIKEITDFDTLHNYDEPVEVDEGIALDRIPEDFIYDFVSYLIYVLEMSPSAWPFLEPVRESDAPGYYEVIKNPIDLSTIKNKLKNKMYHNINLFIDDIILMVENCKYFNGKDSQYSKCAKNIKSTLLSTLEKHEETIKNWSLKYDKSKYFNNYVNY